MPSTREIAGPEVVMVATHQKGCNNCEEATSRLRGWLKNSAPKERHNLAHGGAGSAALG